ncbi:MAG: hypothetical protein TEF_00395 [Rhizobiales bacterium NRL2]|jgi:hypothetical protein|nr:MAG: hypothetical protein TEF_00395 [Rhizobiales bacterium NRL2]
MARRRDQQTMDLFAWEPPKLVARYDEQRVRAADLRIRIARAISETLNDCDLDRSEVAKAMSEWLGEPVSKSTLDAYASPAKEEHTISYLRLMALVHVTGDRRLLQIAAEPLGWSVIEDRWLPWVEVGQLADAKEDLDRHYDMARRLARKGIR